MNLQDKIIKYFEGKVVRKDLSKMIKGNAVVPSYVLEYLLGQHCAVFDKDIIEKGLEKVKNIIKEHYVHRNEAELVKSTIKEKGRHKIIDRVTVELNDKTGCYEARFSNLGLKRVLIETNYIKKHPKLLVGGVWCIIDMIYEYTEDTKQVPWSINTLKPIQVSHVDLDAYLESRKHFTSEEWIDILIQSIGMEPKMFNKRAKMLQLIRLIPFCERNYNIIELGPKGTGKSHIYSEFSPHGILISGGEVTVPKLFVNNATGKIGLVGYWDTVAFDE
ncbi:BREX system Lon protease-like protein BrxL, partial [bacterium]|nr:BREX system Lon protease-like protein BrxL [bacterium]